MSIRKLGIGGLATILWVAVLAVVALPALAVAPEEPSVVTVEAHVPSPVSPSTEAVFHGVLNPLKEGGPGTYEAGTYEFLYKKSKTECKGESKVPASPAISLGGGMEAVTQTASGLKASTEYTVCLLARSGTKGEETVGPSVTFTTATPAETPVTVSPATSIAATTADVEGMVNPSTEAITGYYFAYSTAGKCTEGATTEPVAAEAEAKALKVTGSLAGLEPNKAYKFCLVATNTAGELTAGNEVSLKTLPLAPEAFGEGAGEVKSTGANLEVQINPNNEETNYTFEYSTQASGEPLVLGGTITKLTGTVPSADGAQPVTVPSGAVLEAGKTYFYRVVAENAQSKTEAKPVVLPVQSFTTVPVPSAEAVTAFTATTATFNGHLAPLNQAIATQYHFAYNLGGGGPCTGESSTPAVEAGVGNGAAVATANVTGLEPNHEYTVCLVTSNAFGSVGGTPVYFTTSPVPPKVDSESVTGVTLTEATLEAQISPNNQKVECHFRYWLDEGEDPENTALTVPCEQGSLEGFGEQRASVLLTGLEVGKTYSYRVVLMDTATSETIDGQVQSLTPVGAPLVSTGTAQNVAEGAVTLPGTVNPAGATTAYHFAYISEAGYAEGLAGDPANPFALAKITTAEASVPAGFEAVAVKLPVTELIAATTYEYELVAENASGTTTGPVQSFTTTGTPPAEPGPEPVIPGPAPQASPFAAVTLPPFVPYTSIAALEAQEAKEGKASTPVAKSLTRAEKLAKALRVCRRKGKAQRGGCERRARKQYGPASKKRGKK